jgi:tRNA modification GTPase
LTFIKFKKRKIMNRLKLFQVVISSVRFHSRSSIYALASGSKQKCGVAVVRVSGPATQTILRGLAKQEAASKWEPRRLYLASLWHPVSGAKIDRAMAVWFKAPHSFTGEDVCEFHVHGGPAVLASLFSAIASFKHVRHAEPGEFSKR